MREFVYIMFQRPNQSKFVLIFTLSCIALLALLAVMTVGVDASAFRMCAGCVGQ